MGRPIVEAVQQQQEQINRLHQANSALVSRLAASDLVIDYIARIAGLTPQITAIRTEAARKVADVENPAQPVPNPPSQPATESTEQAATPEAYDDPQAIGQTPGSVQHLPADATGTVMDPGTTLPTAPYNDLVDVQAPVAGTETQLPTEQTRTEVDVRVGDPMNPQQAYPWTMASKQGQQEDPGVRTMASLRLARLRIQAGTAPSTDEFLVQASIEGDQSLSTEAINAEIGTLTGVIQAAASRSTGQRPASAVPRAAASGPVQRTTPSLVGGQPSLQAEASSMGVGGPQEDLTDLFD